MHSIERNVILNANIKDLMIPSEKVAHVQKGNLLEHALLVLIKSGYSSIPVLDSQYKLHGLINTTMILDKTLGIEIIEVDKLSNQKVEDAMICDIPRLKETDEFIKALGLTINHPFVCVVDGNGVFSGIVTRRAILKMITRNLKAHT